MNEERQPLESCSSDANRIAETVASIRGRAKLGLQASSRLSKLIRRLVLTAEGLLVVVDVLVEDEGVVVVSVAVVVTNQMIKVKSEGVDDRREPVLKEVII